MTTPTARARERRAAWVLLAPFLLTTAVFVAYPLYRSVVLALSQTYGVGAEAFVGTLNFRSALTDPVFWIAIRNTAVFTLGSLLVQLPIALGLAMLLNRPGLRGRALYRLIIFMPQLVGLVFAAIIGGVFFAKQTGIINQILNATIGLSLDFAWLEQHIPATLILIALWLYVGFNMIYFLAALQAVDRSLVEAALVDGAGPLARFMNVIVPAIRPVLTFVVLLSFIGSMQLFELPYILLNNSPGPQNGGLTIVMYLYQQGFETGNLGMASAVGWMLGIALMGAAAIQIHLARREAHDQ